MAFYTYFLIGSFRKCRIYKILLNPKRRLSVGGNIKSLVVLFLDQDVTLIFVRRWSLGVLMDDPSDLGWLGMINLGPEEGSSDLRFMQHATGVLFVEREVSSCGLPLPLLAFC